MANFFKRLFAGSNTAEAAVEPNNNTSSAAPASYFSKALEEALANPQARFAAMEANATTKVPGQTPEGMLPSSAIKGPSI